MQRRQKAELSYKLLGWITVVFPQPPHIWGHLEKYFSACMLDLGRLWGLCHLPAFLDACQHSLSNRCSLAAASLGRFWPCGPCLWAARVLRAARGGPISQTESTCSEQRVQHLRGRPDSCQMCWAHCPRSTQLHVNSFLSRKSQTYVVALVCVIFRIAGGPDTHRFWTHSRHSLLYRRLSVPQMGSKIFVQPFPRL